MSSKDSSKIKENNDDPNNKNINKKSLLDTGLQKNSKI